MTRSKEPHIPTDLGPAPRAPGLPLLGAFPSLRKDPLRFMLQVTQRYGDVVDLGGFGSRHFFLVSGAEEVERVFRSEHQLFAKGSNLKLIRPLGGDGLFLSEGDLWRRQRRLLQPAFHISRLSKMTDGMVEATDEMLDGWSRRAADGQPLEVEDEATRLTLKIAVRAFFGADIGGEDARTVAEAVTTAFSVLQGRVWSLMPPPAWLPTRSNQRLRRAVRRLDDVVFRLIESRRRSGIEGDDVLSMLLSVRDADSGEGMTDRQVRDELMTMLVAGHESTALTLTWTLYLISRHPQVERRLHRELDEVLGGRPARFEDLGRLEYLGRLIQESMRLFPAFWAWSRTPVEEVELGGYRIPAGAVLMLSPFVTHRRRDYWRNPEGVDPDRFTAERMARRPELAYYPFGAGPRRCIGFRMAELETKAVLATLASRYCLHLVPGHPVEPMASLSLRPRYGMPMTLERRAPAARPEPQEVPATLAAAG